MLRRLYIRNFVIVDELELEFDAGFTTLTGETGAGKSILIDALMLALGERADTHVIREGAERTEIIAEFDIPTHNEIMQWLKTNDFVESEDLKNKELETCLLRRVIDRAGRSKAYINGIPATLAQLREAADHLADIHGQHAHHSLLRQDAQRSLLDAYAGQQTLAATTAQHYRAWQEAIKNRISAEKDIEGHTRERELLAWQVKELSNLDLELSAWQQTNSEHHRLAHAAKLIEGAQEALQALTEEQNEGELALLPQTEKVTAQLKQLLEYDKDLEEPLDLLNNALIQMQEASYALRRYCDRLELDPQHLQVLEARLSAVHDIARKYRLPPEELPTLLARSETRLNELETLQDTELLIQREKTAQENFLTHAQKLSKERKTAATRLSLAVTEAMLKLAMPTGRFEIALQPNEQGTVYGLENIEFRVTMHPSQALRPLARVASGGELSRIGLAIQVITATACEVPTLIFDEVDVGIGGSVAEIVGHMLKALGKNRQVLCITHLPQVAAKGDWQWSISKETIKEGNTECVISRVAKLDQQARIEEIARMLGGVTITDATRAHATEMLFNVNEL